jgi:hypothetical protein
MSPDRQMSSDKRGNFSDNIFQNLNSKIKGLQSSKDVFIKSTASKQQQQQQQPDETNDQEWYKIVEDYYRATSRLVMKNLSVKEFMSSKNLTMTETQFDPMKRTRRYQNHYKKSNNDLRVYLVKDEDEIQIKKVKTEDQKDKEI